MTRRAHQRRAVQPAGGRARPSSRPEPTGDKVRDLQARLKQIDWFSGDVTGRLRQRPPRPASRASRPSAAIPETGEVDQRTWNRLTGDDRDADRRRDAQPGAEEVCRRVDPRPGLALPDRSGDVHQQAEQLADLGGRRQGRSSGWTSASGPTRRRPATAPSGCSARPTNGVSTLYKTPMPWAMTFSGGQAVHYSPDFAARGYNGASHGCVNVRNYDGIRGSGTRSSSATGSSSTPDTAGNRSAAPGPHRVKRHGSAGGRQPVRGVAPTPVRCGRSGSAGRPR